MYLYFDMNFLIVYVSDIVIVMLIMLCYIKDLCNYLCRFIVL